MSKSKPKSGLFMLGRKLCLWLTILFHAIMMSFATVDLVMHQGKPVVWLGYEVMRLDSADYRTNITHWWQGFAIIALIAAAAAFIAVFIYWVHGRLTVFADSRYQEHATT